jgi:hypothetical protein
MSFGTCASAATGARVNIENVSADARRHRPIQEAIIRPIGASTRARDKLRFYTSATIGLSRQR